MKVNKEVFQELGAFLLVGIAVCAVLMFSSCGSHAPVAPAAAPSVAVEPVGSSSASTEGLRSGDFEVSKSRIDSVLNNPKRRPGLGTGWGERISSSLGNTHFVRENDRPYGGVGMIYYNDKEGVDAMAGRFKNKTSAFQKAANGAVEWGVKSGWGSPDHYMSGSRRYVVGKKGRNYSLVVRNVSDSRLEVVLSVDGLDVMDGKAASFKKRGYIMAPGEELLVKGFRTSYDAVAAFKFSTVDSSYSNLRHGETRDVGVIGLVVFAEKGRSPFRYSTQEVSQRNDARAFADAPLRTVR
ncbi:MAG: hypothetical protein ACSHYB_11715 [Roseibacillus sp.]